MFGTTTAGLLLLRRRITITATITPAIAPIIKLVGVNRKNPVGTTDASASSPTVVHG